MDSKEAREKSVQANLDRALSEINSATLCGQTEVTTEYLSENTIRSLKDLGYSIQEVNYWLLKGWNHYIISW